MSMVPRARLDQAGLVASVGPSLVAQALNAAK
jgi:hypothetical protein